MNSIMLLLVAYAAFIAFVSADMGTFDCKMRNFTLHRAMKLPASKGRLHLIADALQLEVLCNISSDVWKMDSPKESASKLKASIDLSIPAIFVDVHNGHDSNPGTFGLPLQSIQSALSLSRKLYARQPRQIVIRKGTYYLTETLDLLPEDSYLTLKNFGDEEVWISGALPIIPSWKPFDLSNGKNVWVAELDVDVEILGLRVNGERAIRARYPNANPETQGIHTVPSGWVNAAKGWIPSKISGADKSVVVESPIRNDTVSMFQKYTVGIGGACENFFPPVSFWCSKDNGRCCIYRTPKGMILGEAEMNRSQSWGNISGAVVHTFLGFFYSQKGENVSSGLNNWASLMFKVDDFNSTSGTLSWTEGGFQCGIGTDYGTHWYIENLFDELDSADEWFFDKSSKKLFYFYNATSGTEPPIDLKFEVAHLKVLLRSNQSSSELLRSVTVQGIGFRDSAYTYFEPHGVPSGGDWALQRTAAVFIQGAENFTVQDCRFWRLDGIGLMFSGYNRYNVLRRSIFSWIGDSAFAQWGLTDELSHGGLLGYDGVTNVHQPRFTRVSDNFFHEIGIWEKQSSFYFQAKSCRNEIRRNIMFNGPRAGVNFNDGFGGGSLVEDNIVFNTCRETNDHGPFNSWDRQPFLTTVRDGVTPSFTPAENEIRYNLMVGSPSRSEDIDNDDGTGYFVSHHNVLIYGLGGLKSDFDGHDNRHHHNLYAFVGECAGDNANQLPGHNDHFYNNTCVPIPNGSYLTINCKADPSRQLVSGNNTIFYTGSRDTTDVCGKTLSDYQKSTGNDLGSQAFPYPSDEVILELAERILVH